jgi:hypothetical protein
MSLWSTLFGGDDEPDYSDNMSGYESTGNPQSSIGQSVLNDINMNGDDKIGDIPMSSYKQGIDLSSVPGDYDGSTFGQNMNPTVTPGKDTGSMFTDSRVLGPVLTSLLGVGGLIFKNKADQDQFKQAMAEKEKDALYALQLEKLKQQYLGGGSGGGGGGRGGGGSGAANKGALLQAYGNYIQGVNSTNQLRSGSIGQLGSSISGGYKS